MSGADLVPLAGALALAALAGLAAVIATRGVLRRVAGVLLALFGAGAGAAIMTSVTAATVVSVAAIQGRLARVRGRLRRGRARRRAAPSGGGGARRATGSTGHAVMTGTPWHVAVLIGALLDLHRRPGHGAARHGLAGDVRQVRRARAPREAPTGAAAPRGARPRGGR